MSFCRFAHEAVQESTTQVDNVFISQFLPGAPNVCVKVYLFGLFKCQSPDAFNNTLDNFASELDLSKQDVEDAFLYWQEQGLVEILPGEKLEVRFLPAKNARGKMPKFSVSKYAEFNKKAQEILEGRMITATEFVEYYNIMEKHHIAPPAFLLIIDYCASLKGKNVGYPYILTVARNWAQEGCTAHADILERINSYSLCGGEISQILKACGLKHAVTLDEHDLFLKWTRDFDFATNTIIFVAKNLMRKNGKATFAQIDNKLAAYYEARRTTVPEIEDFEAQKALWLQTAKQVCKGIGVFYENLETVVEKYVVHWFDLGHTNSSINMLADFCFKNSTRTLEGLDSLIQKLYKKGIVSTEAIGQYVSSIVREDAEIKTLLSALNVSRNVNAQDREFFKTWKYTWNTTQELLDFAAEKSVGKTIPMQYMNKILSSWHEKGVHTKQEAEALLPQSTQTTQSTAKPQKESWEREYCKEDLEAVFASLEDIEI